MTRKILIEANKDYFYPINLMETTYGSYIPVFLLKSDEKDIFFTNLENYTFLCKFNLLSKFKNMNFESKFRELLLIDQYLIKNTFFVSTLPINWTNAEDLYYDFNGDSLKFSSKHFSQRHFIRENLLPKFLNNKEIFERFSLIDSFQSFTLHPVNNYYIQNPGFFIDLFILRHKLHLNYLKDDIFYLISLFEKHFSSRKEIESYILKSCFSPKDDVRFVASILLEYKKHHPVI